MPEARSIPMPVLASRDLASFMTPPSAAPHVPRKCPLAAGGSPRRAGADRAAPTSDRALSTRMKYTSLPQAL